MEKPRRHFHEGRWPKTACSHKHIRERIQEKNQGDVGKKYSEADTGGVVQSTTTTR